MNLNFDDIRTYFLQVLRDCWQITFVTPDGFCLLSNKNPTPLFLTDNIKTDRILSKIFYIVFQVLKVLLIKICKIQSLDLLFLVVFISFSISRYHFLQVFRTSFNIIWKKDFRHKFSFFNRFIQTHSPHPLNSQNPLSLIKVFCQYCQTCCGFSRLLCYYGARKN